MLPRTRLITTVLALASLLLSSNASAKGQLGLEIGAQGHIWEEFVAGTSTRLLEESGARYTMNLSYDTYTRDSKGLIYGIDFLGYIGELDYDGSTQLGVDAKTSTAYLGSDIRITLGYRLPGTQSKYSWDWLGGLGYNSWGREIGDGVDALNNPFSGYTEIYSVFYGHLGAGLFRRGQSWDQYLQFGFKHPIDISEKVEEPFNVKLEPGANTSCYFNWNFYKRGKDGMRDYAITRYADSFRFAKSPVVSTSVDVNGNSIADDAVFQPESDYSVFGIRLTRYFK